jgi:hypothetical protein
MMIALIANLTAKREDLSVLLLANRCRRPTNKVRGEDSVSHTELPQLSTNICDIMNLLNTTRSVPHVSNNQTIMCRPTKVETSLHAESAPAVVHNIYDDINYHSTLQQPPCSCQLSQTRPARIIDDRLVKPSCTLVVNKLLSGTLMSHPSGFFPCLGHSKSLQ